MWKIYHEVFIQHLTRKDTHDKYIENFQYLFQGKQILFTDLYKILELLGKVSKCLP